MSTTTTISSSVKPRFVVKKRRTNTRPNDLNTTLPATTLAFSPTGSHNDSRSDVAIGLSGIN